MARRRLRDTDTAAGQFDVLAGLLAFFVVFAAWGWLQVTLPGVEPPSDSDMDRAVWEGMRTHGRDILLFADRLPANANDLRLHPSVRDAAAGQSLVAAFLADANAGGDAFRTYVKKQSPPGTGNNLYLCQTPKRCMPLFEDNARAPYQHSVAESRRAVDLRFDHSMVRPLLTHVGEGMDLPVGVVTVKNHRYLHTQAHVGTTVDFVERTRTDYARTSMGHAYAHNVTIVLEEANGLSWKVLEHEDYEAGRVVFEWRLTDSIAPKQGRITWHIPDGWSIHPVFGLAPRDGWTWSNTSKPTTLVLDRNQLISADDAAISFRFTLVPPSTPSHPVDVIPVLYSEGLRGHQHFFVRHPLALPEPMEPSVHLSLPDPLPSGGPALVAVVVRNGHLPSEIRDVRLEASNGVDLFAGVAWWDAPPAPGTLALVDGGRGVRYRPSTPIALEPFEILEVLLSVEANADATDADGRVVRNLRQESSPARADLRFPSNGHEVTLYRAGKHPGVLYADVPAASIDVDAGPPPTVVTRRDGYPWHPLDAAAGGAYAVESTVPSGHTTRTTRGSYATAVLDPDRVLRLRAALEQSLVTTDPPTAWKGGGFDRVLVTANWRALATTLAERGIASVRDTVRVYGPHSLGVHPTYEYEGEERSLPRHGIVGATTGDVDGDTVADVVTWMEDGNVVALQAATGVEAATVAMMPGSVLYAGPSGDGRLLIVLTNGTVALRDGLTGALVWIPGDLGVGGYATAVGVDALPLHLTIGAYRSGGGSIELATLATLSSATWTTTSAPVAKVAVASSYDVLTDAGRPYVAAALETGTVVAWDHTKSVVFAHENLVYGPLTLQEEFGIDPEHTEALRVVDVTADGVRDVLALTSWSRVVRVDGSTRGAAGSPWRPQEGLARAAFVPDMVGDGAPESVFANDVGVVVVRPQTLQTLWTAPWVPLPSRGEIRSCDVTLEAPSVVPCLGAAVLARRPLGVTGDGARVVALAVDAEGAAVVTTFESGQEAWSANVGAGAPGALAWVPALDAVLVGNAQGQASLRHVSSSLEMWRVPVGALTGVFTYTLHIPPTAFLGAWVVESELSWEDADANGVAFTERARQLTIFEVLDLGIEIRYELVLASWREDWRGR